MPDVDGSNTEAERAPEDSSDDFSSDYANNVRFESSAWDLKVIFGELDQRPKEPTVEWHTAITVPWAVSKIMIYYLLLNVAIYERSNGKIPIPTYVIPPAPTPPTGNEEHDPNAKAIYELALEAHRRLFG